jgi:NAD(P)-dependent dehydrogenase (short-subunit alcohol dehydrogenase family)
MSRNIEEREAAMNKKLAGKIAVITGGSAGIGLGIARRFAEEGAKVFITGRNRAALDKAAAEIGSDAVGIQGDAIRTCRTRPSASHPTTAFICFGQKSSAASAAVTSS